MVEVKRKTVISWPLIDPRLSRLDCERLIRIKGNSMAFRSPPSLTASLSQPGACHARGQTEILRRMVF